MPRRLGSLLALGLVLALSAVAAAAACPDSVCIEQVQRGGSVSSLQGLGGIITGFDPIATGFDFYLQNSQGGPFTGIDFFTHSTNTKNAPYNFAAGDSIVVEFATVAEFQGTTQLLAPNNNFGSPDFIVRKVGSGHPLPPFFEGTTTQLQESNSNSFAEQYEGCLVRIGGPLEVVRTSLTGGLGQRAFLVTSSSAPSDSVFIDGSKLTTFEPPIVGTPVSWVRGILSQATRGYRVLLRDAGDIAVDTTGFPVLTSIVGRGNVSRSRIKEQYPSGTPLTLSALPLPGARFVAWTGDTTTTLSSLDIVVSRSLSYIATFELDPTAAPNLTMVSDVPLDQGSLVRVEWSASPIDTGLAGVVLCCYRIERAPTSPDGAPWGEIAIVPAGSLGSYSALVTTPSDSTLGDPAVFKYRVIARANADTAEWPSNEANGYSVDNLAPPAPAAVTGVIASGLASLSWDGVSATDLAGYRVFRGLEDSPPTDAAHLVGTTAATTFNDAPGFYVRYRVTAFDIHGNNSPGTLFVPFNTADAPGSPAPGALSVGRPSPSPTASEMSLRLGLPRASLATVDVLDSQGRLVRRLLQAERPAGWTTLTWDLCDARGRAAAAGLYFVRVQTLEGERTRRVVLTR